MKEPTEQQLYNANWSRILAVLLAIATFLVIVSGTPQTFEAAPLYILSAIPLACLSYYLFGRSRILRAPIPSTTLRTEIVLTLKTKQTFRVYFEYEVPDEFNTSRTGQVMNEAVMKVLEPQCKKLKDPPTLLEVESIAAVAIRSDPEVAALGMKDYSVKISSVGEPSKLPPPDPIGIYVGRA